MTPTKIEEKYGGKEFFAMDAGQDFAVVPCINGMLRRGLTILMGYKRLCAFFGRAFCFMASDAARVGGSSRGDDYCSWEKKGIGCA